MSLSDEFDFDQCEDLAADWESLRYNNSRSDIGATVLRNSNNLSLPTYSGISYISALHVFFFFTFYVEFLNFSRSWIITASAVLIAAGMRNVLFNLRL